MKDAKIHKTDFFTRSDARGTTSGCGFAARRSKIANRICFHTHRGKEKISGLFFIKIVGKPKPDIFSTCVFNNIARLACIFYFPFSCSAFTVSARDLALIQ